MPVAPPTPRAMSATLPPLAVQINEAHEHACTSLRAGLDYARQAGSALLEVKQQLQHGEFLPWVAEHTQLSARTAQGYMRLSREWPRLVAGEDTQRVARLPLRGALALLAEPRRSAENAPVAHGETDWRARASAIVEAWEALEADLAGLRRAVAQPAETLEAAVTLFHEATGLEGRAVALQARTTVEALACTAWLAELEAEVVA